jgi:hypothetical protein
MHRKVGRLARKHSRMSTVIATAVAAAGIGAIGASAGATPWAQAMRNLAMDGHAGASISTGHTTSVFAPVLGQPQPRASAAAPQQTVVGLQLDSHHSQTPSIVGALTSNAVLSTAADAITASHAGGTASTHSGAAPTAAQQAPSVQPSAPQTKPAPPKPAPPKPAPPKPAPPKHAPAPVVHHAPPKPYQIFDSVTPGNIPAGKTAAVYANGNYAASSGQMAGRGHVLWIDTNGSDPHADALDVEPGDATPAGAAAWVQAKLNSDHHSVAIVYTMLSQWQAVKDNVAGLPHWMQDKVRYWIADPTNVDHVVPGANATQWYWGQNYDITTANPGFWS